LAVFAPPPPRERLERPVRGLLAGPQSTLTAFLEAEPGGHETGTLDRFLELAPHAGVLLNELLELTLAEPLRFITGHRHTP
jgi:hypothetical protein